MPVDPRKRKALTWADHKKKWSSCKACELHSKRFRTVLLRGSVPADVIFVGEAPGGSEDTLGRPFCGPAGKLLDDMVGQASERAESLELRTAYTNLIACIPLAGDTKKLEEPPVDCIKACQPRLQEIVDICKPLAIVMVGRLSGKFSPKYIDWDFEASVEIIHPAAILRADQSQQGLAIQKTILQLEDLFLKCLSLKAEKV